jgi:hypothetical protein
LATAWLDELADLSTVARSQAARACARRFFATASSLSACRPEMATVALPRAARAIDPPMPPVAPVTSAVLPEVEHGNL